MKGLNVWILYFYSSDTHATLTDASEESSEYESHAYRKSNSRSVGRPSKLTQLRAKLQRKGMRGQKLRAFKVVHVFVLIFCGPMEARRDTTVQVTRRKPGKICVQEGENLFRTSHECKWVARLQSGLPLLGSLQQKSQHFKACWINCFTNLTQ